MPDALDAVLGLHIAAGAAGLLLGPVVLRAERRPPHRSTAGLAYAWSVAVVALTALALVAADPAALWWLAPVAVLTAGLALLGRSAPGVRAYAHGQGGSYVALVTAALVVSLDGWAALASWLAPTAVGLPLIELRVRHLAAGP